MIAFLTNRGRINRSGLKHIIKGYLADLALHIPIPTYKFKSRGELILRLTKSDPEDSSQC